MNNFFQVDAFNCTYGCENAAQCEYNNGNNFITANQYQVAQQQQQPFINSTTQCVNNKNFDDGVVPSNLYENSNAYQHQQMHLIQPNNNYGGAQFNDLSGANFPVSAAPSAISYNNNNNNNSDNNYFIEQSNVPCRGPQPWNFAECFGFYGDAPCQYANVAVDMEDFM
jgi:hypothetical protein